MNIPFTTAIPHEREAYPKIVREAISELLRLNPSAQLESVTTNDAGRHWAISVTYPGGRVIKVVGVEFDDD